jgi:hypothetical protein
MAAFFRKPLRRAKLFHLFDDEHFDWLAEAAGAESQADSLNYFWCGAVDGAFLPFKS